MHAFTDACGRLWIVSLTVDGLAEVRALAGLNLLELLDDIDLLDRLNADVVLAIDVLYSLLKETAERRGLSDVDFGQSFSGESLAQSFEALAHELIAFFPTLADIDAPKTAAKEPDDGLKASERADKLLWELSGVLGIHPGPFTLRELVRMASGRQRDEWGRLSHLLARVSNVFRGAGDRAVMPADCNPYLADRRQPEPEGSRVSSGAAKGLYTRRTTQTRAPKEPAT